MKDLNRHIDYLGNIATNYTTGLNISELKLYRIH